MAKEIFREGTLHERIETPVDLARSWLRWHEDIVLGEIHNVDQSKDTARGLRPIYMPSPRWSWDEAKAKETFAKFGMSGQQLDFALQASYYQDALREELGNIGHALEKVNEGDAKSIERYAKQEIERRSRIEEREREKARMGELVNETKQVEETTDVPEISDDLDEIFSLLQQRKAKRYQQGTGGWYIAGWSEYETRPPTFPKHARFILYNTPEQTVGKALIKVNIRTDLEKKVIEIEDFRNTEELDDHPYEGKKKKVRKSRYFNAKVAEGKMWEYKTGSLIRPVDQPWDLYGQRSLEEFDQTKINEMAEIIRSLKTDIKDLATTIFTYPRFFV